MELIRVGDDEAKIMRGVPNTFDEIDHRPFIDTFVSNDPIRKDGRVLVAFSKNHYHALLALYTG